MVLSPHVALGAPIMASVVVGASMLTAAANLQPLVTTQETFAMPSIAAFTPDVKPGDFDKAMAAVFAAEGGFSNDPDDPGGATNYGMSIREVQRLDADGQLRGFLREQFDANHDGRITAQDVNLWTRELARTFYRKFYFDMARCGELPGPVALIVFDSAVNEGVTTAARHLQGALGVPVDGIIGTKTIESAWAWKIRAGDLRPEEEIYISRIGRYVTLNKAWKYAEGWARRSFRVLKASQS